MNFFEQVLQPVRACHCPWRIRYHVSQIKRPVPVAAHIEQLRRKGRKITSDTDDENPIGPDLAVLFASSRAPDRSPSRLKLSDWRIESSALRTIVNSKEKRFYAPFQSAQIIGRVNSLLLLYVECHIIRA